MCARSPVSSLFRAAAFILLEKGNTLSMIMSFPMASMQKHEEEMLTLIDAFCSEKLLPRLNDSKNHAAPKLPEGEAACLLEGWK